MTTFHEDLIFDVGMHDAEDTAFYLRKGFRVVAVEANPQLADQARERFAAEIAEGRLHVEAVAIAEDAGTIPLAIADEMTLWSSLDPGFVARNEAQGTTYRYVDVPAVPFGKLLARHGVPYYLKVDIEGFDMLCVRALADVEERPRFVSVESNVTANDADPEKVFDELAQLWVLGYTSFQYVNQREHPSWIAPNPPREGTYVPEVRSIDSSGPFGEELDGAWLPVHAAARRAEALRLHHGISGAGGRYAQTLPAKVYKAARKRTKPIGWYDLHARRY